MLLKIFKINSLFLLLFTLVFSVSCNSNHIKNNNKKISGVTEAHFSIGGMRGSYTVDIKGNKLIYTVHKHRGGGSRQEAIYTLTKNDLDQLEKELISAKATEWSQVYKNPPRMRDGTSWEIKYKSGALNISSKGKNNYPKSFHIIRIYISSTLLKGKEFI